MIEYDDRRCSPALPVRTWWTTNYSRLRCARRTTSAMGGDVATASLLEVWIDEAERVPCFCSRAAVERSRVPEGARAMSAAAWHLRQKADTPPNRGVDRLLRGFRSFNRAAIGSQ